jgi:uncharacterized integral membrane protein
MFRVIAFCAVLMLVGVFALINWEAFSALTPLSLGVTTVQAPLGVIMLGLVVFLCVLFAVWVISLQARSLFEARRQTRELQTQRDLADRAEASRFTELRAELMARLDRMQFELAPALNRSLDLPANSVPVNPTSDEPPKAATGSTWLSPFRR